MICYFPFTHISDSHTTLLADALGPFTLYLPLDSMVTRTMAASIQHGSLTVRTPAGLDSGALTAAVQRFKNWAGVHGTKLSDISDFYKLSQGRPPLVDDNAPSRIRMQIKRRESGESVREPDRLFQSALFLALAHEHDMIHEEADRQLESVAAMEADLYATMSGSIQDEAESSPPRSRATAASNPQRLEARMSLQRLRAWACLAQSCDADDSIFLTASPTVLDHVLERFPNHSPPVRWELNDSDRVIAMKQRRLEALTAYGRAKDPATALPDDGLAGVPGSKRLALHFLAGVAPQDLLLDLAKTEMDTSHGPDIPWLNAVVGLVES